jgi:SAM-dependent methyltransferase
VSDTDRRTITDFGEQWQEFRGNSGYYGSLELLEDILGPLMSIDEIKGKTVADVGSGTGRIVNMLAEAGARRIVAVEPSSSFPILKRNTARYENIIDYLNIRGDELSMKEHFDLVFSFGVLHHIQDPLSCLDACHDALKHGGRIVIWLYGLEGNERYVFLYRTVSRFTKKLPHRILMWLCQLLRFPAVGYGILARRFALPMRMYFLNHYLLLDRQAQIVTLYDQLNPAYVKYYRREEATGLLEASGFVNVKAFHRHGYSWTLVGTKP